MSDKYNSVIMNIPCTGILECPQKIPQPQKQENENDGNPENIQRSIQEFYL